MRSTVNTLITEVFGFTVELRESFQLSMIETLLWTFYRYCYLTCFTFMERKLKQISQIGGAWRLLINRQTMFKNTRFWSDRSAGNAFKHLKVGGCPNQASSLNFWCTLRKAIAIAGSLTLIIKALSETVRFNLASLILLLPLPTQTWKLLPHL